MDDPEPDEVPGALTLFRTGYWYIAPIERPRASDVSPQGRVLIVDDFHFENGGASSRAAMRKVLRSEESSGSTAATATLQLVLSPSNRLRCRIRGRLGERG